MAGSYEHDNEPTGFIKGGWDCLAHSLLLLKYRPCAQFDVFVLFVKMDAKTNGNYKSHHRSLFAGMKT